MLACCTVVDDAELLEQWNAGDATAGELLFERYFEPLHRFFRNKVGDEQQELIQRTLLALVERRERVRDAASFRAFVFGIARYEFLRFLRRKQKADRHDDIGEVTVHDVDPSPSRVMARKQEQRLLIEAIRRIPIDMQIVLELHYWEELPSPEIADVLGVPVGTVKSRIRRAKAALEAKLRTLPTTPELLKSTLAELDAWAAAVRQKALAG